MSRANRHWTSRVLRPFMPERIAPESVHPRALLFISLVAMTDALMGVGVQLSRSAWIGVVGNLITVTALTIGLQRFRRRGSTQELAAWLFPAVVVTLTLVDAIAWGGFGPTSMIWPMVTIGGAVWLAPAHHRLIVATVLLIIATEAGLLLGGVLRPVGDVTTSWILVSWLEATVITSASAVMGTWVYHALRAESLATTEKSRVYESAVGGLGVGLWEYDVQSQMSHVSPKIAERFGVPTCLLDRAEARALFERRLKANDIARLRRSVAQVVRTGHGHELELALKDEFPPVWLRVLITRGHDEHGSTSVRAAIQDVSDAKRREERRTAFFAMMSHELRTPLNGLLGSAELLERAPMDEEHRRYLDTILRTGAHIRGIFDDILDLTRIESGALELATEAIDPRSLVFSAVEIFGLKATRKGIDLSVYVAPDVPSQLTTDPVRARQILVNLVSNAVKFTREGAVRVRATYVDGAVEVAVSDTGAGIPVELVPRIFDAYDRGVYAGGDGPKGQGLGLAIVRRVAEQLGATIGCESTVGEGSLFVVRLPCGPQQETPDTPLAGAHVGVAGLGHGTREVVQAALEDAGAKVIDVEPDQPIGPDLVDVLVANSALTESDHGHVPHVCVLPADAAPRTREQRHGALRYSVKMPIAQRTLVAVCHRALQGRPGVSVPTSQRLLPKRLANLRVLVVDDEPINLEITARTLELEGALVLEAADGTQALEHVDASPLDLILMDLNLPGMSGIEVIQHVAERLGEDTPRIVAFTADATPATRDRALSAGADGILIKPASAAQLVAACQRPS